MKNLQGILLSFVLAAIPSFQAVAGGESPVVIELFTAQGCSSCPPADALLGELARKPNVVALSYHVDYWDELGWKDRFAIPEAVPRQLGYVRRMGRSGAFTPQAVIGGDTSALGSDRGAINRALAVKRDALAVVIPVHVGDVDLHWIRQRIDDQVRCPKAGHRTLVRQVRHHPVVVDRRLQPQVSGPQ